MSRLVVKFPLSEVLVLLSFLNEVFPEDGMGTDLTSPRSAK